MTLVLLLLCSGFVDFTFSSNRLRHFRFNESIKENWTHSLNECKQNNESFVTLYDEEDAMFTANFTNKKVWLGLRKERNITWSNGQPFTFNKSSVPVTDGTQMCQAIENKTWEVDFCSTPKYFMCWRKDTNNYTLVEIKKTWCQARQYCRNRDDDLVSISDEEQNNQVIEKGNNTSFWIGLMHDEWEWEDKGCSSFRKWTNASIHNPDNCTTHRANEEPRLLYRFGCGNTAYLFCSRGRVRIKAIPKKLTWEEAFNYCEAHYTRLLWIENGEDQKAVEQWLNHTQVDGPFWIGLRQSRIFGFWIWTSDRVVNYSNWKGVKQPELPMSNHCGVIDEKDDYTWSDENCLVPLHFLCEEEIEFMKK
ncbi:secretory phospholipase A2 receptor-like [Pagrus major]|uniref:secretory phospholipase A2 receptor-like n=1 Tax=Pagrus major TaxID=143350 RepID=UPI003CC85A7C